MTTSTHNPPRAAADKNGAESVRELLKKVRRIEITTRRVVNEVMAGQYHSVFKGRGMEFSEVREYTPGDDVRIIDWNVTARAGHPYVKVFHEERELTVILMVDASSSLYFGTRDKQKAELAAELCALLAFSAVRNNDRVGLIIFTDQVERSIPPKKGRTHVLRIIREVLFFKPQGKHTDIAAALEYLSRVHKRKAVVFLISDFMATGYDKAISIAGKRHDLIAVPLSDPREKQLEPVGLIELEDAETGERIVVDTYDQHTRELFAAITREADARRDHVFLSRDLDNIPVSAGEPYDRSLIKFFKARARRAR
ncbi:MAG TPA: DUF58 domain-containing protein [bacterium]|nr:DUF58 domain-containing protein [bacterium]